jgi:hypothetical protein
MTWRLFSQLREYIAKQGTTTGEFAEPDRSRRATRHWLHEPIHSCLLEDASDLARSSASFRKLLSRSGMFLMLYVLCLVDGTLYWGSGYKEIAPGTGNNKPYAFSLPWTGDSCRQLGETCGRFVRACWARRPCRDYGAAWTNHILVGAISRKRLLAEPKVPPARSLTGEEANNATPRPKSVIRDMLREPALGLKHEGAPFVRCWPVSQHFSSHIFIKLYLPNVQGAIRRSFQLLLL